MVVYTMLAVLFALLIIHSIIIGKELDDIRETLKLNDKWEHEFHDAQNGVNNNLITTCDKMFARIGDLNTRVIELEARIPDDISADTDGDAPNLFPDVEDEDIVI